MPLPATDLSPHKPAGSLRRFARVLINQARILRHYCGNWGKLSWGRNLFIGRRAMIYIPTHGSFGENISIGADFVSQVNFSIGNDCLISSRVSFIGHDHELFDPQTTAYWSGRSPPSFITLEGDNFIGYGATLLGSITIGQGSIVAAHALVTKNVPPNSVVGGVPAKIIKSRF